SKPVITSAKSTGKGKIKITWKKVTNATAYMVYRKTAGSSKWVRVKTTKSTSFTNTGLKSGKKYTYKVISYKQSGVKRSFSKYSAGKTVKAK
ncbi:MAG: fibronectin type III domain-containing protein, partial [Candidatus Weimeria sp.]